MRAEQGTYTSCARTMTQPAHNVHIMLLHQAYIRTHKAEPPRREMKCTAIRTRETSGRPHSVLDHTAIPDHKRVTTPSCAATLDCPTQEGNVRTQCDCP